MAAFRAQVELMSANGRMGVPPWTECRTRRMTAFGTVAWISNRASSGKTWTSRVQRIGRFVWLLSRLEGLDAGLEVWLGTQVRVTSDRTLGACQRYCRFGIEERCGWVRWCWDRGSRLPRPDPLPQSKPIMAIMPSTVSSASPAALPAPAIKMVLVGGRDLVPPLQTPSPGWGAAAGLALAGRVP